MIITGKLIEYLDNGKFICALVIESQQKRLRLINQNGRTVNLPISRVLHCSQGNHPTNLDLDSLTKHLQATVAKRCLLMNDIDLEEIWQLANEDESHSFSPSFLAELIFGAHTDDDAVAAFIRRVIKDKLFFKYKEGQIQVNSPEKIEQLQIQRQKEAKHVQLVNEGAEALAQLAGSEPPLQDLLPLQKEVINIIRDYYLFGSDAAEPDIAQKILKMAKLHKAHDPFYLLVKLGIWSPHENIALLRSDLTVNFSLPARQQAEQILQHDQSELFNDPGRIDLTHLKPITIDGPSTLDFDDALSIEKEDDNYLVGVHISDVAHYVHPGDPLFLEAMRRGTAIYFPEVQIPMLPRHLSQGMCSLIQGETRATFSFMILLSPEAEVLKVRLTPSIIRVKRRLTYDEVDRMLETDREIQLLDMLRKNLRVRRIKNGALLLPFPDVNIFIDNCDKVHVNLAKSDTPARTIVSEMMVLANCEAAKYVADRMVPGLFRSQAPLQKRIVHGEDADLFQNTLQRKNIPRGELSTTPKAHSGLGVPHYTTITSPIRRLLDLVMQHQLNSIVRRQEPCFTEEMCKDFTSVLSRTLSTANGVRQQRQRYWLIKYLVDRQGQYIDALVISVGPKRINLLLVDILMDIVMPKSDNAGAVANTAVKVRIVKADPLDNTVHFDW